MGMSVLRGRAFDATDTRTSRKVILVNETFVKRYLKGVTPVGAMIRAAVEPGMAAVSYEVVGVVRDAKYADLREEIPPVSFALTAQEPQVAPWMAIMMRASGPESAAASIVRRVLDDEQVPTPGVVIFREQVGENLMREQLMAWLSGFFGVVAGLLAAIGLYGVMSYTVAVGARSSRQSPALRAWPQRSNNDRARGLRPDSGHVGRRVYSCRAGSPCLTRQRYPA